MATDPQDASGRSRTATVGDAWVTARRARPCPADALPCFSSAMPSPGIEPGLRPSQSRVRIQHTPRTCIYLPPGSRTRPNGFEGRRASTTPAGIPCVPLLASVSPPGVEPGPRPSEGRVPSVTLRGHAVVPHHTPASPTGFEPVISTVTGWRALQAAPRGRYLPWPRRDSNPQHLSV